MKKCTVILVALLIHVAAFGQVPQSGIYNGAADIFIVRDEQAKTLTGSYNTCIHDGHICCTFNFIAHYKSLNDKELHFITTFPDDDDHSDEIKGKVICKTSKSFFIKLEQEPPGSMACYGIDKENGDEATFVRAKNWKGIKMISSRKAFFYSEPNDSAKRKAYVTLYDVVGILDSVKGWVKVEFDNVQSEKPQSTIGWIKESDIFPHL